MTKDHSSGADAGFANVLHSDGAGTKAVLAYLYWKETGDTSVFKGIAQDAIVMNIDDMLCVGCYKNFLFSSLINRNAKRIPGDVLLAIQKGTEECLDRLTELGISAHFNFGETADIGDVVQTIIVDGSCVGRLRKENVIQTSNIEVGDVVVGLASDGQAIYEDVPNSGIGSNGLTLARHVLLHEEYIQKYPESYDNSLSKEYVYTGPYRLTDHPKEMPMPIGRYLLSPTRTYAPLVRDLLMEHRPKIHALIHCTGGGQTKIRRFLKGGLHVLKDNWFPIPAIFKHIQKCGQIAWKEMYEVFNMGHRFEVYTDAKTADWLIKRAADYGIKAQRIGRIKEAPRDQCQVTLKTPYGTFSRKEKSLFLI